MANVFRVDPVGPLIKPPALLAAEAAFMRGALDQSALAAAQGEAIQQALLWQKELALPVMSDGEMRRIHVDAPYCDAISGLQRRSVPAAGDWQSDWCAGGEVRATGRLTDAETAFLFSKTKRLFKISLWSPSTLALRLYQPGGFYPNLRELASAFAPIVATEITALAQEGVAYIQLSCPAYAWLYDPAARAHLARLGAALQDEFEALLQVDVGMLEGINKVPTSSLGLHIGRWQGMDQSSTIFEQMLQQLLPRLPVDRFLLEYADARPHDFSALSTLPANRIAALGLVSSDAEPEPLEEIVARLDAAATHISDRSLAIGMRTRLKADPALSAEALAARQRRVYETTLDAAQRLWGLEL